MMAVPISSHSGLPAGVSKVLFTGQFQRSDQPHYDVTGDGQRFVMIRLIEDELEPRTIRVVDGWADELKGHALPSR